MLQRLLNEARALDPDEREVFLRGIRAGSFELADELEVLLANDDDPVDDASTVEPRSRIAHGGDEFLASMLTRLARRRRENTGRYEMRGEVARGGQGAVLRVWDADLRRSLAMKVVLGSGNAETTGETPDLDSRTLGRFLEEAQVTGQLDHPGIIPVHEIGVDDDDRVYFTMKLVKGESLAEVFEKVGRGEDGWSQTRALGVLLKVCEALAYAHRKNVIHRDLKPSNVMVGRLGEVYVMDWGLARVLGSEDTKDIRVAPPPQSTVVRSDRRDVVDPDSPLVTMDGDVVGTPSYMSPEQARGDLEAMGPRSDVYACGAILYELLAGHPPYVKPGMRVTPYAVWYRVQEGPPEDIGELAGAAPGELVAICRRAMAREPNDRYADTLEMAEDLRAFLEGRVVQAYRTGALIELRKWVGRNRGVAMASVVAVLAVVVGLGAVGFVQARERELANRQKEIADEQKAIAIEQRAVALEQKEAAENERAAKEDALREARRHSYVANVRSARLSLDAGNVREAKRALSRCPEEFRNFEWAHLNLATSRYALEFGHGARGLSSLAFRPDGEWLATGGDGSAIRIWNARTGELMSTLEGHEHWVTQLIFTPDGRDLVAVDSQGAVRLWDLKTREPRLAFAGTTADSNAVPLALSPDGSLVASSLDEAHVRVWNTETGETLHTLGGHTEDVVHLAFAPDGTLLASGSYDGSVRLWDVATGTLQAVLEHENGVRGLSFFPQGERVATCSADGTVAVWEVATGDLIESLGDGIGAYALAVSPDGARVAWGGSTGVLHVWTPGDDDPVRFEDEGVITAVAFDRTGRFVARHADGGVRVWDLWTSQLVTDIEGAGAFNGKIAFAPDGPTLAIGAVDDSVQIWNVPTREAFVPIGSEPGYPSSTFALSGDGALLYQAVGISAMRVFSTASGTRVREIGEFNVANGMSPRITISPGGDFLAVVPERGRPLIYEGESFSRTAWLRVKGVKGIAFNADASALATGSSDNAVHTWDPRNGAETHALEPGSYPASALAFSIDGTSLVACSLDGVVRLHDLATGASRVLAELGFPPESVSFSPDGSRLAVGGNDGSLGLLDAASGDVLHRLTGHIKPVLSLAFSPDGTRLASGSWGSTIRLWDTSTGETVDVITAPDELAFVQRLEFSPDGRRLYASFRGGVIAWVSDRDDARRLWSGEGTAEEARELARVSAANAKRDSETIVVDGVSYVAPESYLDQAREVLRDLPSFAETEIRYGDWWTLTGPGELPSPLAVAGPLTAYGASVPTGPRRSDGSRTSWRQGVWMVVRNKGEVISSLFHESRSYYPADWLLESAGRFVDNEREGEWAFWHENGELRARGRFEGGEMVGEWTFWDDAGAVDEELSGEYSASEKAR